MNKRDNFPLRTFLIIAVTVLLVGAMTVLTLLVLINLGSDDTPSDSTSFAFSEETSTVPESSDESSEGEASQIIIEISDIGDLTSETSEETSEEEGISHGWVINSHGYTYVYGDTGLEQFNYKNTALDRYVNNLNLLASLLPEKSRMFNIIAPVQATFLGIPREIYTSDNFYNASQKAFVSTVESKLTERIGDIPLIGKLERRYNENEYLFFRTDKNWTAKAAYYAYTEYCEKAGLTAYSLSSFTKRSSEGYLGNFYYATSSEAMRKNPDTLDYYYPYAGIDCTLTCYLNGRVYTSYRLSGNDSGRIDPFGVYLGMEAERYEIKTTSSGGSLLVIGDTSAAPMLPFLASHYGRIVYINPLLYKGDLKAFLTENTFDDVLTLCYGTSAISGDYVPSFNEIIGANIDG